MNIMIFGQLEEITGTSVIAINRVTDTEFLIKALYEKFPLFKEKMFVVAVDKKIVTGKTQIVEQAKVALLPPFSGG